MDISLHALRIQASASELRHDEKAGADSRTLLPRRDEVNGFGGEPEHDDSVKFTSVRRNFDPVWSHRYNHRWFCKAIFQVIDEESQGVNLVVVPETRFSTYFRRF